ncbi:MAG TPA: hypothetical protein VMG12_18645 [Polyangiaceae bacterium]|nr:hypothetical protein [Polyangiaceae bacterium]
MTQTTVHHALRSLALGALVALSACETITSKLTEKLSEKAVEAAVEKAIEGNSGADVDIDSSGKAVTIKAKNDKGEEVVLQTHADKLPDAWPKDIPPYPGAKINGSFMTGKGGMLMSETTDTPEQVLAFYRSKVSQMKQKSEMKLENHSMLSFEDEATHRGLAVGATSQDGKTAIHLQIFDQN